MSSEDDDLEMFMKELEENTISSDNEEEDSTYVELPPINEEDFEKKLMSGVAMLLDSCNEVAHNLKTRIKAGDNYEGTMMGFAQATDNTIKALKILETRRNMRLKEEIEERRMDKQHKNRLEIEEKKNEGKSLSNVKNITQNNTFVGSPEEFFKKMKAIENGLNEDDDVVDI